MAQTNVSIRMAAELKRQFEEFCVSMTRAFCVFARKVVRESRIPFEADREILQRGDPPGQRGGAPDESGLQPGEDLHRCRTDDAEAVGGVGRRIKSDRPRGFSGI